MNNKDIVFDIIKRSKKHLTAYEILDKFQKFKKIQPDVLIYEKNGKDVKYILDTKYKDTFKEDASPDIKGEDIRQLLDYMTYLGKNEAYLIYPKTSKSRPDEYKAENRDFTVKTRYIDIDKALDLLSIQDEKVRREEIQKLLREIIN